MSVASMDCRAPGVLAMTSDILRTSNVEQE